MIRNTIVSGKTLATQAAQYEAQIARTKEQYERQLASRDNDLKDANARADLLLQVNLKNARVAESLVSRSNTHRADDP